MKGTKKALGKKLQQIRKCKISYLVQNEKKNCFVIRKEFRRSANPQAETCNSVI